VFHTNPGRKLLLFVLLLSTYSLGAQDKAIDVQRSTITVQVGKSGFLSVAGHDHTVDAPISTGTLDDSEKSRIEFRVQAAKLQVQPDSGDDRKNQAEIQSTMQEKVLESAKYPDIVFRSTSVEKAGDAAWNVKGDLTLHGATRPVAVSVQKEGDVYAGTAVIKQTDFGIQPISVGGVVKVKNELRIAFRIVAK
jgi:polyisoprenoid-binding protein YceI